MPKVELELKSLPGARFISATAYQGRRGINWGELEELCARYWDRILLPEGAELPEGVKIVPPALPKFERQVLLDTACEIIKRSKMPMYRRVVGLIDSTGEFAGYLPTLLKHFTSVRVVTENVERYELERERMMEELGAPVLVGAELPGPGECVLALSPRSFHAKYPEKLTCPVIAGGAFLSQGACDCVSGLEVLPGEEWLTLCPPGILPHSFVGAAYEFCGVQKVPTVAGTVLHNHRKATLEEIVRLVLHCAGYNGPGMQLLD